MSDTEKDLIALLEQERIVIRAMQAKLNKGIRGIFYRKPWRSSESMGWYTGDTFYVKITNFIEWLKYAHDCQDPAIGCSCRSSFRYGLRRH